MVVDDMRIGRLQGWLAPLMLVMVIVSTGCVSLCENTGINQYLSPEGKWKAIVFRRNCGALSWWTTEVSIVSASDGVPKGDIGNVATVMDNRESGSFVSNSAGVIELRIRWLSDRTILVSAPRKALLWRKADHVGLFQRVEIQYSSYD